MAHTSPTTLFRTAALAAACGLAVTAAAQTAGAPAEPLLSGPAVESTENTPSLVRRGFDGAMERQRIQPETAALELLELNDAEGSAVDAVLTQRRALIDGIVRTNLTDVQRFFEAHKARDRGAMRAAMGDLRVALQPAIDEGPLFDLVAAALPASERDAYRAIVGEYHAAARDARRAEMAERAGRGDGPRRRRGRDAPPGMGGPDAFDSDAPPPGDWMDGPLAGLGLDDAPPPHDVDTLDRPARRGDRAPGPGGRELAAMRGLMHEVGMSYAGMVTDAQAQGDAFQDMLARLDLTDEQRASIESIMRTARESRLAAGDGLEPTREERRAITRAIAQELTLEQRRAFRELMREQRGGRP